MSTIITSVDRHSPAERAGITPGEQLLTINGHQIIDVLDYRFYGYDTDCCLELRASRKVSRWLLQDKTTTSWQT